MKVIVEVECHVPCDIIRRVLDKFLDDFGYEYGEVKVEEVRDEDPQD